MFSQMRILFLEISIFKFELLKAINYLKFRIEESYQHLVLPGFDKFY